jgi:uncharacterized protein (TIGR03086 family)
MDTIESYKRAQDGFGTVLAAVPATMWDAPSACAQWSVRDVAGHVIWGQHQVRAWATGEDYQSKTGFPGSTDPGELTGVDPVATWQQARAASNAVLNEETLARIITVRGLGDLPLAAMVTLLTTDLLTHTWDIGHSVGLDVRLDPELVPSSYAWAQKNVTTRDPAFFGPEVTPPAGADEQTKLLAYLGRAS